MLVITKKTEYKELNLPQELYRGDLFATADSDMGYFDIYAGLQRKYVDQLKAYSLDTDDEALQTNTSDYKRFGLGGYEQWYAKERFAIILVHRESDQLASILWYGPRTLLHVTGLPVDYADTPADAWDTIAMRTYGTFRGKGITTAFCTFALGKYLETHVGREMWLAVQKENEAGVRLYTKLGFEMAGEDEVENEFVMTLKK